MRRVLALIVILASPSFAAWDKGFNFRATSGFVTDGTNETYVLDTDLYPTTRNSVTFGWISGSDPDTLGGGARDRDSGIDRRIAGLNFLANQLSSGTFRVDVPATGNYTFQLGYGDAGGNAQNNYISIQNSNGSVLVGPLHVNTLATPTFGDASGNTYTSANWPSNESTVSGSVSVNGTYINLWLGSGLTNDGTNSTIDHLFIHQVANASAPTITILPGTSGTVTFLGGSGGTVTSR